MKSILSLLVLTFLATETYAAKILSARLDNKKENILLDVSYGGGCGQHDFSLDLGMCLESYPVQCQAELVHKTKDFCETLISDTVVINLAKYELNTSYFKNGTLTITGDQDWKTKKPSQATVRLP